MQPFYQCCPCPSWVHGCPHTWVNTCDLEPALGDLTSSHGILAHGSLDSSHNSLFPPGPAPGPSCVLCPLSRNFSLSLVSRPSSPTCSLSRGAHPDCAASARPSQLRLGNVTLFLCVFTWGPSAHSCEWVLGSVLPSWGAWPLATGAGSASLPAPSAVPGI